MNEENVETVRRAYAAWEERGIDGIAAAMHPEVVWYPPPQAPEPGPHRGVETILRMVRSYMESFDEFRPVPERILPGADPDQVVVVGTLTSRGKGSGAEITMPVGHLLTLREGKVIRFEVFPDQGEALRAAGLE